MGNSMTRFIPRQAAVTMILAVSTALAIAADAPPAQAPAQPAAQGQQQPQFDAPPARPYSVPTKGIKDYIKAAVESPTRAINATIHDFYRKPAEILQFSNIRPGNRVVELSAYGNYWSMMLSDIVGPKGELYMYDPPFASPMVPQGEAFVKLHPNTKFQNIDYNKMEFPKGVDLVWCVACFHEVMITTDLDPFLAKLYKAMKPGANFLVIFYTARDSMENRDVGALHRLDPATVRGTIQAAGFQLSEENRLLENHDDNKKTEVFTEEQGDLADRMIYRFRKP
jgi:predicted methyltransferase